MSSTEVSSKIKEKKKSKKSKTSAPEAIGPVPQPEVEETVTAAEPDKKKHKKPKKSKFSISDDVDATEEPTVGETIPEPELEPIEKEKKKKKSKKSKIEDAPPTLEEPASPANSSDDKKSSKKRKRPSTLEEEIEVDITLPEPLSKKAARKAKKAKTADTTKPATDGSDAERDEATVPSSGPKEKKERRTAWGIWIGNLPWSASKNDVQDFLRKEAFLGPNEITRIHMPAPTNAPPRNGEKPKNKGFAYLDFESPEALESALKVSETQFTNDQRKVLIKKSTVFEGRPEPKKEEEGPKADNGMSTLSADKMNAQKPASKRVFVGNLGFDTTKDDLENHFGQCGEVVDVHMATFEDSGKCKGYAWITFTTEEAGIAAVRGWIMKGGSNDSDEESDSDNVPIPTKEDISEKLEDEGNTSDDLNVEKEAQHVLKSRLKQTKRKKTRVHKWFVNKLFSRALRVEFAEDAGVRYKKRYGKDAQKKDGEGDVEMGEVDAAEGEGEKKKPAKDSSTPHERRKEARRAASKRDFGKVDARTIAPGAALAHAQRNTGAIVEAKGKKITFD